MPIDVNRPFPGGLQGIGAFIGRYGSPEAAESDLQFNQPNGARNFITDNYTRLTGDYFADPFKDAAKQRDLALMSTIDAGKGIGAAGTPQGSISVAAGGTLGPSILGIGSNSPLQQGPGLATLQPLSTQPHTPDTFGMAMVNNPLANDLSNQQRRVNETGDAGVQLYSHLKESNPNALSPLSHDNQMLQLDEKGHPVAGNVLNQDLFNDPRFQTLYKTNPVQAKKIYQAIHGRDLDQDMAMQAAHEGAVNKSDRDVIDQFKKSGDFDEFGEPYIRQMVSDPFNPGQQKESQRPLSFFEKKVLAKNGTLQNLTGQEAPKGMDLSSAGNLTPEEKAQLIKNYKQTNPKDPPAVRMLQARKASGAGVTSGTGNAPTTVETLAQLRGEDPMTDVANMGVGIANAGIGIANLPIRAYNFGKTAANENNVPTSLFPSIPFRSTRLTTPDIRRRQAEAEALQSHLARARMR